MSQRIALVGIGKIARDQHIPAIANDDVFELAATASRNNGLDGIDRFSDLASLLAARPDIPCISLCTPPQFRYEDARRALEAGRHVMLEKPPGATVSEVHDLKDLADARGLSLFATWHSRYAAGVAAARDWLVGKDIQTVDVIWKEDVRRWHPDQEWIWTAGGLGVFDPGINGISVLTAIFPRALHLINAALDFPSNRDTPIAAKLAFRDPGGARVNAVFDWRQEGPPSWDIRITTPDNAALLSEGGAVFAVNGEVLTSGDNCEYSNLYARFGDLLGASESDVDISPLCHTADAFLIGQRTETEAFSY